MAFRELAEKADKIGTLNITPDLLDTLLSDGDGRQQQQQQPHR